MEAISLSISKIARFLRVPGHRDPIYPLVQAIKKSETADATTAASWKLTERPAAAPASEGSEPAAFAAEPVGRRLAEDEEAAEVEEAGALPDGRPEGKPEDRTEAVEEPLADALLEDDSPPMTGGSVAVEGSTRAPTPQGMGALVPG